MTIALRQSTASQVIPIGYFVDSTDGNTEETALSIANTDLKIWKAGATSLVSKNSGGATHMSNGVYYMTLDATDTNTVGPLIVHCHVSGALVTKVECVVLEEAVYDALYAASAPGYLQPTTAGRTLDVSATGEAGIDWANIGSPTTTVNLSGTSTSTVATATATTTVNGLAAGVITATSIAADAITDAKVASDVTIASVTGAVGSVTGNVGGNVTGSVGSVVSRVTANADQLAGQTITAAAGVTFPTSVASPTNITAGTITTVTNLTNAPTSGDLTATMKASVTTAATAATPSVTVSDKTGFSLSSAGIQAIWDAATSLLTTVGSIGKKLVDSVTQTGDSYARLGAPAGASVSADIAAVKTVADSILVDTGTDIPAQINGIGTSGGAAINTDATTDNSAGGISGVTSGTTKVGTQTGTYTNTSNVNNTYHQITHSGNAIDWVYQFLTGGGTSPVGVSWTGYLDGSNDTITFYAWNHVGGAWESIGTQIGQAGTTNITKNLILYARHRGTSAAELGKVYIRLACTGQTSPILYTDQLYVSYSVTSRSVGYADGAVWVDTIGGIAGTESFVNGVADNPSLTLADALTIASNNNLRNFRIANGATITLSATTSNKVFDGHEWTLALGGQNIASSMFIDASVSGSSTGTLAEFLDCTIDGVTISASQYYNCGFTGTFTFGAAGDYSFIECFNAVPGDSVPIFDLGASGATTANFRRWSGGMTINNIATGDVIMIDCVSGSTITLNGANGTVKVSGMCNVVDNRTGSPVLDKTNNMDARFDTVDTANAAIKAVTDKLDTALELDGAVYRYTTNSLEQAPTGGGASDGSGFTAIPWNPAWDAEVQSECADALIAYDPPTNAEMEARTIVSANYATSSALTTAQNDLDILTGSDGVTLATSQPNYAPYTGTPPTASAIADQVWDEVLSGHLTAGTTGAKLNTASTLDASGVRTAVGLASANLDTQLGDIPTVSEFNARTIVSADYATASALAVVDGVVDSILVDTAEIGVAGAGLTNINLPDQTMNITGNLSGSVGSVTSGVTVTTNNDKTGYSISGTLTTLDALDTAQDIQHSTTQSSLSTLTTTANSILTDTAEIGVAGAGLTNINLPNQTMDIIGNITGNLSGSVGSVTDRVTANVDQIAGSATAATNLSKSALGIVYGTAVTGTLSTTQMTTDLTETTHDHYIGRIIVWTSGVLTNQASDVTDYNGTTKMLTFTATTEAPSNGDTWVMV